MAASNQKYFIIKINETSHTVTLENLAPIISSRIARTLINSPNNTIHLVGDAEALAWIIEFIYWGEIDTTKLQAASHSLLQRVAFYAEKNGLRRLTLAIDRRREKLAELQDQIKSSIRTVSKNVTAAFPALVGENKGALTELGEAFISHMESDLDSDLEDSDDDYSRSRSDDSRDDDDAEQSQDSRGDSEVLNAVLRQTAAAAAAAQVAID